MKTILLLFLLTPLFALSQTGQIIKVINEKRDTAHVYPIWGKAESIGYNTTIGSGSFEPMHRIVIAGDGKARLNIDFKGDSMVVTGDMKLTEGAKRFIDYCRQYFKTKIDSLQFKVDLLELKILNDPWNTKNPKYQAK